MIVIDASVVTIALADDGAGVRFARERLLGEGALRALRCSTSR